MSMSKNTAPKYSHNSGFGCTESTENRYISSLRSQRLSELQSDIAQQYVTFRLRLAWFILPIDSIYRVISLEKHIPKLTFSGQNVPTINLGRVKMRA